MTPEEKKKRKRTRVWRIVIPVLLAGMFASLAILENKGVFAAVNKAVAPATEEKPRPVPVPLTRLSVVNRLETDGFEEYDGLLMRGGTEAGTLALSGDDGGLTGVRYTLILLPEEAIPAGEAGEAMRAQAALDRENARLVSRAILEAVLGGEQPAEKQLQQSDGKLESVLSAKDGKTASCTVSSCTVTYTKSCENGLFLLTAEAKRN